MNCKDGLPKNEHAERQLAGLLTSLTSESLNLTDEDGNERTLALLPATEVFLRCEGSSNRSPYHSCGLQRGYKIQVTLDGSQRAQSILAYQPLLELRNVSVTYARSHTRAHPLQDFGCVLYPGQVMVVTGASGAGKTTLLNVIAGTLRKPHPARTWLGRTLQHMSLPQCDGKLDGQVLINGEDVSFLEPRDRPVGLVMQHFNLYPGSVRYNLEFPLRMMKKVPREDWNTRIDEVVRKAEIKPAWLKCPVEDLSGGEQQRVAIAKMLLRDPQIALLDEAFSSLDFDLRRALRDEIKDFVKEPNTERAVVFVTHHSEDFHLAHTVVWFHRTFDSNGEPTDKCEVGLSCGKKLAGEFALEQLEKIELVGDKKAE